MASISLPFSLTRPSANESVTDASQIDDSVYGKSQHAINAELYARPSGGGGGVSTIDLDAIEEASQGSFAYTGQTFIYHKQPAHVRVFCDTDNLLEDLEDSDDNPDRKCMVFCANHYSDGTQGQDYIVFRWSDDDEEYHFLTTYYYDSTPDVIRRIFGEAYATTEYDGIMSALDKQKLNSALLPTSLKTINNQSIVGTGNITIQGGGGGTGLGHVATDGSYSVVILDPSKSFASQITAENTVYVIQDEFDLDGKIVWMKKNITLWFYGGMLKNGCIKNIKITGGNAIYQTKIISEYRKVCFQNVLVHGWYRGTAYDWMFEDTVRTEDDYLLLYNLCMFEKSIIIEKRQIDIKTWLNPYYDTYDLNQDNTGKNKSNDKAINPWCGVNIDGNGCTVNILMDDEDKIAQCGSVSRAEPTYDDDGNIIDYGFVYGIQLITPLIRCRHRFNTSDEVFNGFIIKNINIIDDKSINGKGADLTKYDRTIIDPKYGVEVTSKFHQNFIFGGDHAIVLIENVKYRSAFQFGAFGGNSDWGDKSLPNMYVKNCDMNVSNYFIFENFSGQRYRSFDAVYYSDCLFTGTSAVASNTTTKTKEVFTSCVINQHTNANEDDDNVFYQYNNCIFEGGSCPVYGNETLCNKEINNCIIKCYGVNPIRLSQSGYTLKMLNTKCETIWNNCQFLVDYTTAENLRTTLKFRDFGVQTTVVKFLNCIIQLANSSSFSLSESDFSGTIVMENCKITSKKIGTVSFFKSHKALINVTNDTNLSSLLTNPLNIDIADKNSVYGSYSVGWNYLTVPSGAVVVGEEIVSCALKNITMCNTDIKFYGGNISITLQVDFPNIGYILPQPTGQNFKFYFELGGYTLTIANNFGYSGLTLTLGNTSQNRTWTLSADTLEGLHNYTFVLNEDGDAMFYLDGKRNSYNNVQSKLAGATVKYDGSIIDFGGNTIENTKLLVGQICGVRQIIIRPMVLS